MKLYKILKYKERAFIFYNEDSYVSWSFYYRNDKYNTMLTYVFNNTSFMETNYINIMRTYGLYDEMELLEVLFTGYGTLTIRIIGNMGN